MSQPVLTDLLFVSPQSADFDRTGARDLFTRHAADLDDTQGFDFLITHSLFWNVYDAGGFVGCLFVFEEEGKNYIGGYAQRKKHLSCVKAVRAVCRLFPILYAKTRHLNAVLCLKAAGFEWDNQSRGTLCFKKK